MLARLIAGIAVLALVSPSVPGAQSVDGGDRASYVLKFQSIGVAEPIHLDGYTFTLVEDADAEFETRLHAFIQAPGDPQPRQFYSYGRAMGFAFVPACHLIVVEDGYTTKLARSVAIRLPDLKQTNLDEDAVAQYRGTYEVSPTMFVNGFAEAVWRDCKQVLVRVELTFGNARTPEEAAAEGKRYPKRQYEVSPATGKVVGALTAEGTKTSRH